MESSSPKVLNLYPIDYPFETLVGRVNSNPPKLVLNPDFQRKYKWDKEGWERASRFIESCLMRIPLPACYFAETDNGQQLVIDGVQRITTISKFFNDEFALEGLSTFNELEGKKFSELGDYKNELESTTIRCIILRKENPKFLIQEIFSRLNQGAVKLSNQEIRHAIFPGTLDRLLIELSEHSVIKSFNVGKKKPKPKINLEDQEQVLRFFALQEELDHYQDKLSKFLDNYMNNNQNLPANQINHLRDLFNSTIDKVITVFGEDAFIDTNKSMRKQSMVYYDLLMWSFSSISQDIINEKKDTIKERFQQLCADEDFQKTLSGGLQNKSSILRRRRLWQEMISDIS